MKITEFNSIPLHESYFDNYGHRDPDSIRANAIASFLEWHDNEGFNDWSNGLLPELLAIHLSAIGARGNESAEMLKLMKIAAKKIVQQYTEIYEAGELPDSEEELIGGLDELKQLNVLPTVIPLMQKRIAELVEKHWEDAENDEDDEDDFQLD